MGTGRRPVGQVAVLYPSTAHMRAPHVQDKAQVICLVVCAAGWLMPSLAQSCLWGMDVRLRGPACAQHVPSCCRVRWCPATSYTTGVACRLGARPERQVHGAFRTQGQMDRSGVVLDVWTLYMSWNVSLQAADVAEEPCWWQLVLADKVPWSHGQRSLVAGAPHSTACAQCWLHCNHICGLTSISDDDTTTTPGKCRKSPSSNVTHATERRRCCALEQSEMFARQALHMERCPDLTNCSQSVAGQCLQRSKLTPPYIGRRMQVCMHLSLGCAFGAAWRRGREEENGDEE